jgi:hypothetical protein
MMNHPKGEGYKAIRVCSGDSSQNISQETAV